MVDPLPLTLLAYRNLMSAAAPLVPLVLKLRLKRAQEHPIRFAERCGDATVARPDGPLVWLHGASVGELLAMLPLIEFLRTQKMHVLVTSHTVTSATLAEERLPDDVIHQFLPLDAPRFVNRFLEHWQPDLALFFESDLWPNLIIANSDRGIPLILLNARMSQRSFNRWRLLPKTTAFLLRTFDRCLAQSALDADRFQKLGMSGVRVTGNLKLDVPAPPVDERKLKSMQTRIANRPVIAAASTHRGEEVNVIKAHRRLRDNFPRLLTVIIPRHPDRGQEISDLAIACKLRPMLRSSGALPEPSTEVYIGDTIGELGLIYRVAPIVFIGGSLIEHGGQNPIEAIKLGATILHGPHVSNFTEIYAELDAAGGAREVSDPDQLAAIAGAWLTDEPARRVVAEAALTVVERLGGTVGRTIAELELYLMRRRSVERFNASERA